MTAIGKLPADWQAVLGSAGSDATLLEIDARVAAARSVDDVYPPADNVFAALRLTPYESVRAVVLGQDPYHGPGQAHGLAFSVPDGAPIPPSLRNVRLELRDDLGLTLPDSGSLAAWARNGGLLLNSVLTVTKGKPGSHRAFGWQRVTNAVVRAVQDVDRPVAFLLWGKSASSTAGTIASPHLAIYSSHPSPFSQKGFRGTHPFSRANAWLQSHGEAPIDWRLK